MSPLAYLDKKKLTHLLEAHGLLKLHGKNEQMADEAAYKSMQNK